MTFSELKVGQRFSVCPNDGKFRVWTKIDEEYATDYSVPIMSATFQPGEEVHPVEQYFEHDRIKIDAPPQTATKYIDGKLVDVPHETVFGLLAGSVSGIQ